MGGERVSPGNMRGSSKLKLISCSINECQGEIGKKTPHNQVMGGKNKNFKMKKEN